MIITEKEQKMKNYAVICEYNPFHKGHEYLISSVKKEGDTVTAIMSGDFTERGECAVISKYERARAAVMGGADLVLELPFPYSVSGSEKFAFGGIDIISRLGFIDEIVFGSECADKEKIRTAAENILSENFSASLSLSVKENAGKPYGAVYFDTYRKLYGEDFAFDGSNDILAVAYVSELIKRKSEIGFSCVRREGESFNGAGNGISSASTIRRALADGDEKLPFMLPDYSYKILAEQKDRGNISDAERLFPVFSAFLTSKTAEELSSFAENDMTLSQRLINAARSAHSMEELYSLTATKKYSMSRIRRALVFSFFGVMPYMLSQRRAYTLLLAANKKGRELLASARKKSSIPIITKPADYIKENDEVKRAFSLSRRVSALWGLSLENTESTSDIMKKSPYIF